MWNKRLGERRKRGEGDSERRETDRKVRIEGRGKEGKNEERKKLRRGRDKSIEKRGQRK